SAALPGRVLAAIARHDSRRSRVSRAPRDHTWISIRLRTFATISIRSQQAEFWLDHSVPSPCRPAGGRPAAGVVRDGACRSVPRAGGRAARSDRRDTRRVMLETDTPRALEQALQALEHQFAALPDFQAPAVEGTAAVLADVAARLGNNFPYFHPLYAGQMLKPPHPVARAAYALATWINPNNHALDGGRASSEMDREAVAQIAAMFGWREHLGHLAGGGTMANLEALWVAGRLHPGKKIVASSQSHYTHERISGVFLLPFAKVATDRRGRMDPAALECLAKNGEIGCVVATLGTTATGSVDPLPEILGLGERYGFRVHVDAAYGGYFTLADNLGPEARAAFDRV